MAWKTQLDLLLAREKLEPKPVASVAYKRATPLSVTKHDELTQLAENKKVREAAELFNKMLKSDTPPDITAYNTLLKLYKRVRDKESFFDVVELMISQNMSPNAPTYVIIFSGIGKLLGYQEARLAFIDLKTHGYLSTSFYNVMLSLHAKENNSKAVEHVWSEIRAWRKMVPKEVLQQNTEEREHFGPNVLTMNILLRFYIKRDEAEKIEQLYKDMLKYHIRPNPDTVILYANYYYLRGAHDKLQELVDATRENKTFWWTTTLYTALLTIYTETENDEQFQICEQEIWEKNTHVSPELSVLLLQWYQKEQMFDMVDRLHERINQRGNYDIRVFAVLYDIYSQQNRQREAQRLWELMQDLGFDPYLAVTMGSRARE